MSRLCPCCGLPITPAAVGVAVATTSSGGQHGAYALCKRCDHENRGLPAGAVFKRLARAGDRALARPDRYLCTLYADLATARLAIALAGHPQHSRQAIAALGWGCETGLQD